MYRTRNGHPRYTGESWLPQLRKMACELGMPGYEKTSVQPVSKPVSTPQARTIKPVASTTQYTPVSKPVPTPKQNTTHMTYSTQKGNVVSQASTLMGPCVWCVSEEIKPIKPLYLQGGTSPIYLCYAHEQEARRKQVSTFSHLTPPTLPINPARQVTKNQSTTVKRLTPSALGTISSLVREWVDD